MAIHAMIDIETLGTSPDCVVLSVGAVKFDPFTNIEPHNRLLWRPTLGYSCSLFQIRHLRGVGFDQPARLGGAQTSTGECD